MSSRLSNVAANCDLVIESMTGERTIVERLMELGFYPTQIIRVLRRLPFRGPAIIQVGSTSVALRKSETDCILVSEK
jgi:Fe2+ transport system protein FeoA